MDLGQLPSRATTTDMRSCPLYPSTSGNPHDLRPIRYISWNVFCRGLYNFKTRQPSVGWAIEYRDIYGKWYMGSVPRRCDIPGGIQSVEYFDTENAAEEYAKSIPIQYFDVHVLCMDCQKVKRVKPTKPLTKSLTVDEINWCMCAGD